MARRAWVAVRDDKRKGTSPTYTAGLINYGLRTDELSDCFRRKRGETDMSNRDTVAFNINLMFNLHS